MALLSEAAAVPPDTDTSERALSPVTAKSTLALCSLVYGFSYVAVKMLQDHLTGEVVLMLRFLLAAIMFLPSLVTFRGDIGVVLAGLELGMWCSLGFMAQAVGLSFSTASKASLITSLMVVMPPVFDLLERFLYPSATRRDLKGKGGKSRDSVWQRLRHSRFASSLLALLGAGILEWGGMEAPSWLDALLLITPISFALCFWRSERFASLYPKDTKVLTSLMLTSTAFYAAGWARWQGQLRDWTEVQVLGQVLLQKPWVVLLLLFQGFIATGWTALSEQKALKVVTASEASLIYTIEPIFATLFACFLLHEHIGWNAVLGALLIIAACVNGGSHDH
eukprot:gene9766-10800_t